MNIIKDFISVNYTANWIKEVRGLVIHSMDGTYQGTISWFRNTDSKASAHFLISASGEIRQMVREKDGAWHAGIVDSGKMPSWASPNPNMYTLGIELEDKGDSNWPYPEPQREALRWLVKDLMNRFKIPRERILLHKDLTPSTRSDPQGQFSFDWLFKENDAIDLEKMLTKKLIDEAWNRLKEFEDLRKQGLIDRDDSIQTQTQKWLKYSEDKKKQIKQLENDLINKNKEIKELQDKLKNQKKTITVEQFINKIKDVEITL